MLFHHLKAHANTVREVGMANVEAESDIREMRNVQEFGQPFCRREFIGNVLEQHRDSKRLGEGAQVLDSSHRRIKLCRREALMRLPQMLNEEAEWEMLCNLDGALDFIHGLDTHPLFRIDNV